MTTLKNTTIKNIIEKTSFKKDGLQANLLITGMNCGFTFIQSFKNSKLLTK